MPEPTNRRKKRFLAPQQKYEIWMQLIRGETTISEAADRVGVDRTTIIKARDTAKQGALDALAASKPGRRVEQRDRELEGARGEIERLQKAISELAVRLMLAEGKEPWD